MSEHDDAREALDEADPGDSGQAGGDRPLDFKRIESLLNGYLDPVLSSRRTAEEPARGLLPLVGEQQRFALHWTDVIRKSNAEMAYQFVSRAPLALKLMGTDGARAWLLHAMDVYDREGLYPGGAALEAVEPFAREYRLSHVTVRLEEVQNILETILRGLSGRNLSVVPGNTVYTDTETLYLPAAVNRFDDRRLNYLFYKILSVHLWAQTWFGTFRRPRPGSPHLQELLGRFEDGGRALRLFNLLETFRLNACIRRELPGLAREIYGLYPTPAVQDSTWQAQIDRLEAGNSTVYDTLQCTALLYPLTQPWPDPFPYQGELDPAAARQTIETRVALEQTRLQTALTDLIESLMKAGQQDGSDGDDPDLKASRNESGEPEITLDGEPVPVPADIRELLSSVTQDFDEVPPEWLDPAGDGSYDERAGSEAGTELPQSVNPKDTEVFVYDEWDYRRQTYRKNWCMLRELTTHPSYDDFTDRTLEKYHHLVGEIRRHFEALRGEDRVLRAQPVGDDIDLDALVTAHADTQTGVEMTDRLYTQQRRQERDLAVVFMVDVSGSTKGWINDAERESLVLLCQALEVLGDQYAIYGFSGMTRNRCEVYRIKTFGESYGRDVRARISGLRPQDYTRMGATIRHLTHILNRIEARTRILITLSDGKPDDYDGYRGSYGIEDTRQALLEARHDGIHPFCITIDTDAGDYLPHMYGHASFVVIDEVRKLPLKVADIYRRLTT